jgi:hypothetical protein
MLLLLVVVVVVMVVVVVVVVVLIKAETPHSFLLLCQMRALLLALEQQHSVPANKVAKFLIEGESLTVGSKRPPPPQPPTRKCHTRFPAHDA